MNKTRILLITIVSLVAVLSVLAQEQSQVPTPSQSPAIDLQGVRNYLLGPGDVLDVRVFGQSDLNTLAEIDGDGNISSLPFLEKPIRSAGERANRAAQQPSAGDALWRRAQSNVGYHDAARAPA